MPPLALSALTAAVHHLVRLFADVSISVTAAWLNVALSLLALVPAYFFVRRQTNPFGGFAAALLAGTTLSFASHALPGIYDTDAFLEFLPMLLFTGLMVAMSGRTAKERVLWSLCSAAALVLMRNWWVMYFVYLAAALGMCLVAIPIVLATPQRFLPAQPQASSRIYGLTKFGTLRGLCFWLLLMLTVTLLFARDFFISIAGTLSSSGAASLYPLVTTTVAELQPLPLWEGSLWAETGSVVGRLGGPALCAFVLLTLAGMLIMAFELLIRTKKGKSCKLALSGSELFANLIILIPWIAIGGYLATTGIRFVQMAAIPFVLLGGIGAGLLYELAGRCGRRTALLRGAVCVLCAALILPQCLTLRSAAEEYTPVVSAPLEDAALYLRDNTAENTAVATWWDYGYYYQYTAQRRCMIDGGGCGPCEAYYLAHMLMTDDPALSVGLMRMLSYSLVRAPSLLTELTGSDARAAEILFDILPLDEKAARAALLDKYALAEDDAAALLSYTHPHDPAPTVLAISSDMLMKLDAIAYYGLYELSSDANRSSFTFLASAEAVAYEEGKKVNIPLSAAGNVKLRVGIEGDDVQAMAVSNGAPLPLGRVILMDEGEMRLDNSIDAGGFTLILSAESGRMSAVLAEEAIANSVLVRLCLLGGSDIDRRFSLLWESEANADGATKALLRTACINGTPANVQLWQPK